MPTQLSIMQLKKPSTECSCRSVEEASYTAEVKTTNKWSGHSNIEITFKNTGTETIHDWYFTFDFNYKIENPFKGNYEQKQR